MTTTEFSLGGTLIVVSRLGPEMMGLTVHGTAEDGSGVMLLCLTALREECEIGTGHAPWPEERPHADRPAVSPQRRAAGPDDAGTGTGARDGAAVPGGRCALMVVGTSAGIARGRTRARGLAKSRTHRNHRHPLETP